MKKILMIFLISVCVASMAYSLEFVTHSSDSFNHSTNLYINYYYSPDNIYKFKFSDMSVSKDSDFNDLFDTPGLDWITMTTLENGRLKNDKNTYIYWMSDRYAPINRLTVELPGALCSSTGNLLDWYAVVDGGIMVGGKAGYGPENAKTIYQRDMSQPIEELKDSVQVKLWTDDVTGKPAGDYVGSLVLRVYGEN